MISLHNMLPFELTKDTPYLALSGELWSVFYEYFNRNWSCYKGFLLYQLNHGQDKYMSSILISLHSMLPFELTKDTPYLALSGELWSVFYEYFNRNWSCYKGFLLDVLYWWGSDNVVHYNCFSVHMILGPVSIQRPSYLRMAISMLKIRRPLGRLIFNMGIAIPGKTVFLIETAPCAPSQYKDRLIYVWRFPC